MFEQNKKVIITLIMNQNICFFEIDIGLLQNSHHFKARLICVKMILIKKTFDLNKVIKWDKILYISTLPSYIFTNQGSSGIANDCKLFHFNDIKSKPLLASSTVHFACLLVK